MAASERRVGQLLLKARSEDDARRMLPTLEDALRCASLPDEGGRLLLVRRLALGRLARGLSAQALAMRIEQRVAEAPQQWVAGTAAGAEAAAQVWFDGPLEARIALALRLARGEPATAWFWPLAVPEVHLERGAREALRRIAQGIAAWPEARRAWPAWVGALAGAGHAAVLAAAITPAEGRALARHCGVRVPDEAEPPRSPATGDPGAVGPQGAYEPGLEAAAEATPAWLRCTLDAVAAEASPAAAEAVLRPTRRYPHESAERPSDRPALRERDGPRAVPSDTAPVAAPAAADERAAASSSKPASSRAAPRRLADVDADAGTDAQPASQARPTPPRRLADIPAAAPNQPGPRRTLPDPLDGDPTAAAGLLFLLPVLARLGLPRWCEDEAAAASFARRVLRAALRRLRIAQDDPIGSVIGPVELAPAWPREAQLGAAGRPPRAAAAHAGHRGRCRCAGRDLARDGAALALARRAHRPGGAGAPARPRGADGDPRRPALQPRPGRAAHPPRRPRSRSRLAALVRPGRRLPLRAGAGMNMRLPEAVAGAVAGVAGRCPLHRIALALLAEPPGNGPEATWLKAQRAQVPAPALQQWREGPPPEDRALHALAQQLPLHPAETLALALAVAVEFDPMLARALAWLQAPVGGARPTLGLLHLPQLPDALPALMQGQAHRCGLLQWDEDPVRPLPERSMWVPQPLALALRGLQASWPGTRELALGDVPVPPSLAEAAAAQAAALRATGGGLAVRSGNPEEAQLGAVLVAQALGLRPLALEGELPRGIGPWLWLERVLPVLRADPAPGETTTIERVPGYGGPFVVACGPDGAVACRGESPLPGWRVPLPAPAERQRLWQQLVPEGARPAWPGRQGTLHVRDLARAAQRGALLAGREHPAPEDLQRALREGPGAELGTLAQRIDDEVLDAALVLPPPVREALVALAERCRRREQLAAVLGPAVQARYRPGVRALFAGPSGTGKTLAAAWLATRLRLPLYRVDIAAVSSKYIGETEKNLAQLFARAEHAELVLLFDEADALFARRTEVRDANDRFANQQTNYLLQRIEAFDGIAVLTSNGRGRFDTAFARRLDAVIDFALPAPEARRALWLAHLGPAHGLDDAQLNRIAGCCDLPGGHIRSATLAAASAAGGPVAPSYAGLRAAIEAEYRKLGRQPPPGL